MTRLGTLKNVQNAERGLKIAGAKIIKTRDTVIASIGGQEVFRALKTGSILWVCWYNPKFYRT